jgi:hypothetical protein
MIDMFPEESELEAKRVSQARDRGMWIRSSRATGGNYFSVIKTGPTQPDTKQQPSFISDQPDTKQEVDIH